MKLFSNIFRRIGLDLGTTRTRIWFDSAEGIIDEPTCIAVDQEVNRVVAVGKDAFDMKGRVSQKIKIYHPVENGVIVQPAILQAFLRVLMQRVLPNSYFFRPIIMVNVSSVAQAVDRQVLVDSLYEVGAREVYVINESLAAAIGSDIPIADATGSFVFHLGGGVVEAAVISFGTLFTNQSSQKAGLYADEVIQQLVRDETSLEISRRTAERIKRNVVSLSLVEREELITGQDIVEGAPRELMVSSAVVDQAVFPLTDEYVELLRHLLEKIPPELTTDVIDKGMLLTGGLAQLSGLDQYLVKRLGVPVSVVDYPQTVVIKGIATALQHLELFKESLGYAG